MSAATERDAPAQSGHSGWACKAQPMGVVPSDCAWPNCGCDPNFERVVRGLRESGWTVATPAPRDRVGQQQRLEADIASFNADATELVEILDALLGKFCREHERDARIRDVEHAAGKLRFFLVRMC